MQVQDVLPAPGAGSLTYATGPLSSYGSLLFSHLLLLTPCQFVQLWSMEQYLSALSHLTNLTPITEPNHVLVVTSNNVNLTPKTKPNHITLFCWQPAIVIFFLH